MKEDAYINSNIVSTCNATDDILTAIHKGIALHTCLRISFTFMMKQPSGVQRLYALHTSAPEQAIIDHTQTSERGFQTLISGLQERGLSGTS